MKRAIIKKRKKKERSSDLQKRIINGKYCGQQEPAVPVDPTPSDKIRFYNWCSYMVKRPAAREWLETRLAELDLPSARRVPDRWVNLSLCYRARLMSLGVSFTEEETRLWRTHLDKMMTHENELTEEVSESDTPAEQAPQKPTIQDRIRQKTSDVAAEVHGMIDDDRVQDIERFYHENQVSAKTAQEVADRLRPWLLELQQATSGKVEGYTKGKDLRDELARLSHVVEFSDRFAQNKVRSRAPRKKKAPSLEKKLRFLVESYLKHSRDYDVTSVDPVKIPGSQELWVLNTRYGILTVFRAESHGGQLDVSRCKITGFDQNDSYSYRTGRRTKDLVDEVLKSSVKECRKVVSGLKTVSSIQERINENCLLLRVR
jgi:hypothetical protein